jgi:hypothetical protein
MTRTKQISWRSMIVLYLIALAVYGGMAALQSAPGYMDADYYFAGGLQIARGEGLWEPFLWNYLDDPSGLPHPSYAYWMPLASWAAAFGMLLTGSLTFDASQIGMILLAAGVPPLTALLTSKLSRRPRDALLAGGLALFSGFYLPYLTTTDTFGLYMLLGALFLLVVSSENLKAQQGLQRYFRPAGLGVIAGLMHLARADGLIWLATGVLVGFFTAVEWKFKGVKRNVVRSIMEWISVCLAGYLLVMGPWMVRNLAVLGSPLAPGGSKAIWITQYDELYIYPSSQLTFQHWLLPGIGSILASIWKALLQNLQTVIAVQGQIFLAPLIFLGAWSLRRDPRVRTGLIAWVLTLLAMTFVFPYQGARGGLFHSGSAIQPLFWALAPVGLQILVSWASRIRAWQVAQALSVFQIGIIGLAVFLTSVLVTGRVIGSNFRDPQWNHSLEIYQVLGAALDHLGAGTKEITMVNNSPGFFIATGRSAISVPYGSIDVTLQVAQRYHACYLLLEPNHPSGLDSLYQTPESLPGLTYIQSIDQTHFFRFDTCSRASE